MLRKIAIYRVENGVLVVPLGLVTRNPRHAQFVQNSRNILVLELDRAVCSANLRHESLTVPGFNVVLRGKFGREHGEVVGNDRIEFVILPMRPNLRFVSHVVATVEIGVAINFLVHIDGLASSVSRNLDF